MTTTGKSDWSQLVKWFAAGCGGLAILTLCTLSIAVERWEDNWSRQLATLIATDDSIAGFGDGAHAVPITAEAALSVGQSALVDNLRVTVTHAAEIEDTTGLQITPQGYLYWVVQFTIENVSTDERNTHPTVDSQMQFLIHGQYVWEHNRAGDCAPSLQNGVPILAPNAKFDCTLIYYAPQDSQPLYWVYTSTGYEQQAVFKVR